MSATWASLVKIKVNILHTQCEPYSLIPELVSEGPKRIVLEDSLLLFPPLLPFPSLPCTLSHTYTLMNAVSRAHHAGSRVVLSAVGGSVCSEPLLFAVHLPTALIPDRVG